MAAKGGIKKFLTEKYYQYELQTATYVMEPWEKAIVNTIVLSVFSLSAMTMYQYIPILFKLLH